MHNLPSTYFTATSDLLILLILHTTHRSANQTKWTHHLSEKMFLCNLCIKDIKK